MISLKRILALGVVVFAPGCIGTAYGQYNVTGTTAGGGNIIVGSGVLPVLDSSPPLSTGGFDQVTVNPGAIATSIVFTDTTGNTLLNNGVMMTTGSYGGVGAIFYTNYPSIALAGETVINNGTMAGGNAVDMPDSFMPGIPGPGLEFSGYANVFNLVVTNNGSIAGGNDTGSSDSFSFARGSGATAIYVGADLGSVDGFILTNNGSISGGNGPRGGGSALVITAAYNVNDVALTNNGSMTGGNATVAGGSGGYGIILEPDAGGNNLVITNRGRISGGNGAAGGSAGTAIYSTTGNLTINNWGSINAGSGLSSAAVSGFPAVAIFVSGGNNTINLNGQSSVHGTIQASGANDVLNLNFTGMSPAGIAALKGQLAAQGYTPGSNFTGTFTVRGVTYYVDPMLLALHLTSYQLQGRTPNQQAIGMNLDSITGNLPAGSQLPALSDAIEQSGNVPAALEALSPQKYEIYGDLAIANATFQVVSIDARLNNLRNGSESIDTSGIGGDIVTEVVTGNSKNDDTGKESREIQQTAPAPKQWGFFAMGDGLFIRGNPHDADAQQGKADTAGTIAGVDGKVGDRGVIGALFAYNNSAADLGTDGSHATIQSYSGGIYGSWHNDGFYANALTAYTRNNYTSSRNILIPGFDTSANGSTRGNQATANLDAGYEWKPVSYLMLGPMAGMQYTHLGVDGFNESGASAASLAVGSQDVDSLQSRLGIRANYHIATSQHSTFALDFHAAWQHEYLDDSRGIGASFEDSGLAPFAVQTASPRRDAAVIGIGVNATFRDRLTLFVGYELELWNASYFEQTINGGARINF